MFGQSHQLLFKLVEMEVGVGVADFQLFPNLVVEILQELSPRMGHRLIDLKRELVLKFVKRRLDLAGLTALLVDTGNALFEINA